MMDLHDSLDDGLYDLFLMMNCIILLIWWTWIHNITCYLMMNLHDRSVVMMNLHDRSVLMMLLLVNLMMNKCMIIMMMNCIQYLYNLCYLMMFTSASWTCMIFWKMNCMMNLHDRSVVMMFTCMIEVSWWWILMMNCMIYLI